MLVKSVGVSCVCVQKASLSLLPLFSRPLWHSHRFSLWLHPGGMSLPCRMWEWGVSISCSKVARCSLAGLDPVGCWAPFLEGQRIKGFWAPLPSKGTSCLSPRRTVGPKQRLLALAGLESSLQLWASRAVVAVWFVCLLDGHSWLDDGDNCYVDGDDLSGCYLRVRK